MTKPHRLSSEEVMDKCIDGSIKPEDVREMRVINIAGLAQKLSDSGEPEAATRLVEASISLFPTAVIGEFLLKSSVCPPSNVGEFKNMLDSEENRELFYRMWKSGIITRSNIGEIKEDAQEKIDLALREGIKREEEEEMDRIMGKNAWDVITDGDTDDG